MEEILWEERYNTGIDEIDRQHRSLVGIINKLIRARNAGDDTRAIQAVLDELTQYTISHFAFEEELMKKSGYRYLKPHQNVHKAFVRKVEGFANRFRAGEDIVDEFYKLLKVWLLQHIQKDDASGYGAEVKDKMLEVVNSQATDRHGHNWVQQKLKKFFG